MKKIIASLMTLFLVFGLGSIQLIHAEEPAVTTTSSEVSTDDAVTATEDIVVVEAGVTPDSWFYGLDRLVEEVQLFLAQGEVAKATILGKLAEERLAEAEEMADADQQAMAEEMIAEFTATLNAITENIEAAALGADSTADDEQLAQVLASVQALRHGFQLRVNELLVQLDLELAEDPHDAIDEVEDTADAVDGLDDEDADEETSLIKAAIIQVYGLDADIFEQLSAVGLNFGQSKLVAIVIGRANAGQAAGEVAVTVEQVLALRSKGWGNMKKELGLKSGDLGLAIGHILRSAGVAAPEDGDDESACTTTRGLAGAKMKDDADKHQESEKLASQSKAGNGQANGHQKSGK